MVKKPTLILLGILLLLLAFMLWSQKNPSILGNNATATPTSISQPLADWKFSDTRLVKYEISNGQPLTLRMGKDVNSWTLDQHPEVPVDSGKVMQLLSELESLQPVSKLESVSDESAMGLGKDSGKITLVDASGATREVLIGKETATASGTYIKSGDAYYILNTPALINITGLLTVEGLTRPTETPTQLSATPQS